MHRALWIAQIFAGLFFIFTGINHFIVPEGLPEFMSWMYDLSDTLHYVSGTAEILGGLGLILPAATRILPPLVPMAAVGLIIVMGGAIVYHIGRSEYQSMASNVFWILVLAFIAWGRSVREPIEPRAAAA